MEYIHAEGKFRYIAGGRYGKIGDALEAPHEPARFVPFDPEITERALESAGWYGRFASFLSNKARKYEAERDGLREQLKTANELIQCYEGRIRGLVQDNDVYKGFWKQEQAEHKRLGELAAGLRTELETARTTLEEIRDTKIDYYNPDDMWIRSLDMKTYAREALVQIEAGQKGGK